MDSLRKKRMQLKRKVHSIILTKGQAWRDVKMEEWNAKQKFLKAWTKYTKNSKNSSNFLHIAMELGTILKKERIENRKLSQKYQPILSELKTVERKLGIR